jgi:UDP-N-acetylglucosamine acyltransferase
MSIHPTAIIGPDVRIGTDVTVGPYAVIEGHTTIGNGSEIKARAHITGYTEIGEGNIIHMGAVIGHEPQDIAFKSERSYLKIGNNNVFREGSYIHRGTKPESATVIGNNNYFMAYSHAGHNCLIGNNNIFVCNALLAGYVEVGNNAFLSGNVVVHQFCRIGSFAIISGLSAVNKDIPPFMTAGGRPAMVTGLNSVGLRRGGFSADQRSAIKEAFRILFRNGYGTKKALEELQKLPETAEVNEIISFVNSSARGICAGMEYKKQSADESMRGE